MSELEVLTREPKVVSLGNGTQVDVLRMVARQWVRFARPGAEVLSAVKAGLDGKAFTSAEDVVKQIDIFYLLETAGDPLIEAVAVATGKEATFVAELDPADLLDLVDAVVEVNWSFFAGHLLPKVQALGSKWKEKAAEVAGQAPSSA